MTEDEGPDESPDDVEPPPAPTLPYRTPPPGYEVAAARSRQIVGGCLGFVSVGFVGGLWALLLPEPRSIQHGWWQKGLPFAAAVLMTLLCAAGAWFRLAKGGRRGFLAGVLIGACAASLLSGLCFLSQ